ncbi:MAG: hypothetical protein ACLP4V_12095 [Methylocella sp.]
MGKQANLHPQIEQLFRDSINYWASRGEIGRYGNPVNRPDGAYDAMPANVRRQSPSQQSSRQREIAKGEAYGRAFVERMNNRKAASRNGMAFDVTPQREQELQDELGGQCKARVLDYLASKLSPDDYAQARALVKGTDDTHEPTLPMTHQGSSAWGNLADRAERDDGGMPKALAGTYAGEYAKAQARDAAERKEARDGVGSGVGTLLGGLLGSVAGPIGTAVGSQIGGELGGAAEKGLTHMITDPAQAAPVAHSGEEEGDAAPRATTRDSQGYFPSTTKGFEAEQLKRPAMDSRRRIGTLAQDSKQSDFARRFPEVARIKVL